MSLNHIRTLSNVTMIQIMVVASCYDRLEYYILYYIILIDYSL